MSGMIPFLIFFPYVIALLTFIVKPHKVRAVIIYTGAVVLMVVSVAFAALFFMAGGEPITLYVQTETADHVILGAELVLMVFVTVLCFRYRKYWISLLSIIPTLCIAWFELMGPEMPKMHHVYIDRLTVLMCLIIGIVGSLIAIYAAGYMHGYHTVHTEVQDRRNFFYAIMFVFLGSMYGFVTSSNLLWIDFFWEVTSICSFLLIGYTRTPEAVTNSFRALWMNLLGGTALAIGIVYFGLRCGTVDLQSLVDMGSTDEKAALLAVALIAFAALTKSAQMPFSTWLLGAMVAPTPSSALLHSATMVKAGIYILFRLSPAMCGNTVGTFIAFVGGFTFLSASFMAIANSDGKKVLAFSTVSNLGLMVACAGMGTPETIWAGVFLMIFHAVSKSLLFQDIGAVENSIHSRDIEDMSGLLFRLPKLAIFMFIGIAGMFLAPFGMLIAKWSTLRASVDENNILMVLFICFGSATTAFYWTKWMGKLLNKSDTTPAHDITRLNEMISLAIHTLLMIGLCLLYPVLSNIFVHPLVTDLFGTSTEVLSTGLLLLLTVIICAVFAIPLAGALMIRKQRINHKLSYISGINAGDNRSFIGSMGEPVEMNVTSFYFSNLLGEKKVMLPSQTIALIALIVMMAMVIGGVVA